jgi:hypothetical protein
MFIADPSNHTKTRCTEAARHKTSCKQQPDLRAYFARWVARATPHLFGST